LIDHVSGEGRSTQGPRTVGSCSPLTSARGCARTPTSAERLFCHVYGRGKSQAQLIPGWPAAAVTAVRGERCVKRRQLRRRVGVRKTIAGDVSLFNFRCHRNRRVLEPSGQVWRVPADWPDGDRHGGDVRLTCCFRRERGKVHPDTAVRLRAAAGRPSSSRNRERLSTVAGCAGGPARSSDEPPVMGGERRGWVIRG
jgi:hypothetical protein